MPGWRQATGEGAARAVVPRTALAPTDVRNESNGSRVPQAPDRRKGGPSSTPRCRHEKDAGKKMQICDKRNGMRRAENDSNWTDRNKLFDGCEMNSAQKVPREPRAISTKFRKLLFSI